MQPDCTQGLPPGHHRLRCPECGKRPSDKTLSVDVDHDHTVWHCFRCGLAGATRAGRAWSRPAGRARSRPAAPRTAPPTTLHAGLSDYARELWRDTRALSDVALTYLEHRCCEAPPDGSHLRWHPELRHPSGHVGPALVALVTDAVTREPLTLHRTWITAKGKASVDPPRLLLKGHRKAGGVVRLWPDESVTQGLGVAEGIETALSLAIGFQPVWACLDAGNLATLPVLPGIEGLLIGADNDPAGLEAAQQCADRWYRAGADVRILTAPRPGADINDMAREMRG